MLMLLLFTALQAGPAAGSDTGLYVVGPNDVLTITVFNQPTLSGRFPVEADGTLAYPLLGRVPVNGLSIRAVEDEVRGRLAQGYVRDPRVTVTMDLYKSQQIFVMGEVRQPGALQFTGSMTLIEALARAGSVTERAGPEALIVHARDGQAPVQPAVAVPPAGSNGETAHGDAVHVDLRSLQTGQLSENVALRPGDTIFVPRAASVFVLGQVRTAGEYVLRAEAMTVRQVLALAGGVTDRGSTRRLQVIRQVNGKETTTGVDLHDRVQAGDTIVVRGRLF